MPTIEICEAGKDARRLKLGKFYIRKTAEKLGKPVYTFLHADGRWRDSTWNDEGGYTGYFPNRRTATRALEQDE